MTSTTVFVPTTVHHQNTFARFHYAPENHQHQEEQQQQPHPQQTAVSTTVPSVAAPLQVPPINGIHIPLTPENQIPIDSLAIATSDAAAQQRHILAERFKTKTCRNYEMQGFCPYESRCMFAHGEHELRTAAMNIKDGLFTEEAIKAFKRAHRIAQREAQQAAMPPPPAYGEAVAAVQQQVVAVVPQQQVGCGCNGANCTCCCNSGNAAEEVADELYYENNTNNDDAAADVHYDADECCSLASGSCCDYPEAATTEEYFYDGNSHEYVAARPAVAPIAPKAPHFRHNPYSLSEVFVTVGGSSNNSTPNISAPSHANNSSNSGAAVENNNNNYLAPKMVSAPLHVVHAMP